MTHHITALPKLQSTVGQWRAAGQRVALVPTMGALHAGHMALVTAARQRANRVVVSIFVNPTQFGPNEDFARYPRTLDADLSLLQEAGADAAWLPDVATMYPQGFATSIQVAGVSEGLDGVVRPGHFNGVATVVAKLLHQVAPDMAFFGEKDYQQLCVIRQMVQDLNLPFGIIGVPTVREADGLALSSRNQYLSTAERKIAPVLHATLVDVANRLKQTPSVTPFLQSPDNVVSEILANAKATILDAGFASVDYLELCDHETLQPLHRYQPSARLLLAATLGTTRLIDNIGV